MSKEELKIVINDIINDYNLDIIALIVIVLFGIYIFFISPKIFVSTTDAVIDTHLINVTSRASGQVLQSYINREQEVKKGDLLIEIDSKDYENELVKLETDLEINKEKLRMMGVNVKDTESINNEIEQNNQRQCVSAPPRYIKGSDSITNYSKTYEPEDIAQQNIDRKKKILVQNQQQIKELDTQTVSDNLEIEKPEIDKSNIDISNDTVESVQKEIKNIENQKNEVKLRISATRVFAPCDGKISSVSINEGDVINPNDVICSIIPSQVWVLARVNPERLKEIHVGQSAYIKIPGYKYRTFKGTISSVDKTLKVYRVNARSTIEELDSEGNQVSKFSPAYQIKIDFIEDYSDFFLKPDTEVNVKVLVR